MSFRRRTVLLAAGAVAAAVVLASLAVYLITGNELRSQLDSSLTALVTPGRHEAVRIKVNAPSPALAEALLKRAGVPAYSAHGNSMVRVAKARPPGGSGLSLEQQASSGGVVEYGGAVKGHGPAGASLVLPANGLGPPSGYVQLTLADGRVLRTAGPTSSHIPFTAATRAVAMGRRPDFFSDATISGAPVRVLTARTPSGAVWQAALPLSNLNSTLSHLRLVLAIVCLGGIVLAALLGLLVSRAALAPVRRLTGAAEQVARTQDLGHRIQTDDDDELGRLSASFNEMLAALERSRLAQRQLISDASHELRTPLTSVQANLDALALGEELPPAERERIIAAAQAQMHELTVLVGDLVDLSKDDVAQVELEDVRLDLAAGAAVERARLHAPDAVFSLDAEPGLVRAAPARLDRAIANLLDNAIKWSPPDAPIEVTVRDGRLEVRDHGPGIAGEDLPRVFDRFYRATAARSRPGSGLGLAIVRQMAETHGGSVSAANDPQGGARLTLELPALKMTADELAAVGSDAPGGRSL
ncbi:MAG TPA: HAMP domain-containing sensor histidine kinase [Solirubrobacteraceae bacterium]|nr:HAMP domain-containing sensor histidine kinase [Solirubrobacteraceae bacterium]